MDREETSRDGSSAILRADGIQNRRRVTFEVTQTAEIQRNTRFRDEADEHSFAKSTRAAGLSTNSAMRWARFLCNRLRRRTARITAPIYSTLICPQKRQTFEMATFHFNTFMATKTSVDTASGTCGGLSETVSSPTCVDTSTLVVYHSPLTLVSNIGTIPSRPSTPMFA